MYYLEKEKVLATDLFLSLVSEKLIAIKREEEDYSGMYKNFDCIHKSVPFPVFYKLVGLLWVFSQNHLKVCKTTKCFLLGFVFAFFLTRSRVFT